MLRYLLLIAAFVFATPALSEGEVFITKDMPFAEIETENGTVVIERIQDVENELWGEWSRTSRPCPPFCIQPINAVEGTTLIGELEMIAALQDPDTVVIDVRSRSSYQAGTIPGAINVPFDQITHKLEDLGCEPDFDGYDCSTAKKVALFCNGPWCGQSPSAARFMIAAGYPPELISLYRGGMQVWNMFGLTVATPK